MSNAKCPFCGVVMKTGTPFYDKYSGKYTSHAKCWGCGAQGPIAKSGSSSIVTNRAMKLASTRPYQKTLRFASLETMPVVWLEEVGKKEVVPAFPDPVHDRGMMSFQTSEQELVTVIKSDYGKRWRAWATQPTANERKGTAWTKS